MRGPEEGHPSCFLSRVLLTKAVFFVFFLSDEPLRNEIAK